MSSQFSHLRAAPLLPHAPPHLQAVWKDAAIQTGFGWHWDHTYWGGVPKTSTWVALDDADVDNGCLMLVP